MTRLGKILVMLNLAFSLMLATWSLNNYANGLDWTDTKSKGSPPVPTGQFAIRAVKLDELWKGVAPNQSDWLRERGKLAEEERRLAAERVWYDKEIRFVQSGKTQGNPVKEVAMAVKDDKQSGVKKGEILLDDQGFPQLEPVRDPNNAPLQLLSLTEYNAEIDRIAKAIEQQMKTHAQQIAEANALTDKIIGDKGKGIRGLQQRINDEQTKSADLLAEMKLVEPQLINTLVEAQLVNKRHEQMARRIEELKRIKVAGR